MIKIKISLIVFTLLLGSFAKADEGMWLPFLLGRNYQDMKEHGLRLTEEEIYDINNSSIKDAIISFNGYCTGEVISNEGLILTNHHCGYPSIAGVSTAENNYLDNGFWAKNHGEEIAIPGLFASFIIRIQDVSETINSELTADMTEAEREAKIKEISALLTEEAVNGTGYTAFVEDFFAGNEFYLFVKETFNDVRLVGTPPQSAGKFGGDTDNWMWPRHTADFSMFRIYANKENKPSRFAEGNLPYVPKHSLPVSIKGVQENDFAMILGYPGSTDRYSSSWGVDQLVSKEYPTRIKIRNRKLEIMKKYMDADVNIRLKYSSRYAQVANYWKNFIGMSLQVKKNGVIEKKQDIEGLYRDYLKNVRMSFDVLGAMEGYVKATDPIVDIRSYQQEFVRRMGINQTAITFEVWVETQEKIENADNLSEAENKKNQAYMARVQPWLFNRMDKYFVDENPATELEMIHDLLDMYIEDISEDQMGEITANIAAKGHSGVDKYTAKLKKKSMFFNKDLYEKFKSKPSIKAIQKDPLYALMTDMNAAYEAASGTEEITTAKDKLKTAKRYFVAGLRDMNPNKQYYPDANSTLRLTYGNVLPYDPKDGVTYHYTTTLDGIMQKEDPTNPEFVVDPRIKETWLKKDYGQYADADGRLVVNFLSNNDITGGNSGSPVINADGELIGTAFDGNWEAMSGDIYFEPNIQRTISLDIRYTLWLIDKCFGATNIIDEMNLVK